jgi:HK97 family phage prohead protease
MKKTQYFQMEFKNVEVKEDGKTLIVEGYASTPDIDSYDDIVEPSAFQNTMGDYMSKYKGQVFLQHIREKIVGKTTDYRIEEDGLWVRIEFYNDIDGLFKNIQAGMISSFSIGFRAVSWEIEMIDERRVRRIKELQLVEISAVN